MPGMYDEEILLLPNHNAATGERRYNNTTTPPPSIGHKWLTERKRKGSCREPNKLPSTGRGDNAFHILLYDTFATNNNAATGERGWYNTNPYPVHPELRNFVQAISNICLVGENTTSCY